VNHPSARGVDMGRTTVHRADGWFTVCYKGHRRRRRPTHSSPSNLQPCHTSSSSCPAGKPPHPYAASRQALAKHAITSITTTHNTPTTTSQPSLLALVVAVFVGVSLSHRIAPISGYVRAAMARASTPLQARAVVVWAFGNRIYSCPGLAAYLTSTQC